MRVFLLPDTLFNLANARRDGLDVVFPLLGFGRRAINAVGQLFLIALQLCLEAGGRELSAAVGGRDC